MCEGEIKSGRRSASVFDKKATFVEKVTCKGAYDPILYKPKQTLEILTTIFEDGSTWIGCKFFPRSGNSFGVCQNVKPSCKAAAEESIKRESCYLYKV